MGRPRVTVPGAVAVDPVAPHTPGPRRRGSATLTVATAAVVLLALTAMLFYHWGSTGRTAAPTRPGASPSPSRPPTTAEVYTALAPSVVSIEATGGTGEVDAGTGVIVNDDAPS